MNHKLFNLVPLHSTTYSVSTVKSHQLYSALLNGEFANTAQKKFGQKNS